MSSFNTGYVGSANDAPKAATVANIQNTIHPNSMGMKPPEYTPHLALGVSLAAAHNYSICGERNEMRGTLVILFH